MMKILLYIWQLPQNILGLLFLLCLKGKQELLVDNIRFYYIDTFPGGISLGDYIILGYKNARSVRHEYGHCIQSRYLGWLYLPVVGLPSLLHAAFCECRKHSYYDFWTEAWADKLGGVKR